MTDYRGFVARGWVGLASLSLVVIVACGGAQTAPPVPEMEAAAADAGLTSDFVPRPLPNPTLEVILNWAPLPDGRVWGSTAGIDIGPDGHVWDGTFIKEWGEIGFRPGQFRTPHAMEFDSQGRLYVADRGNHRLQIFDQDGNLLEIYTQYSRISGLFITDDDTLYAIDSESGVNNHPG